MLIAGAQCFAVSTLWLCTSCIIIKIAATTVSEKSIKNIMCTLSSELPLGNDAVDDAGRKQHRAIEFISSTLF